jgi:hypothetical protein
MSGMYKKSMWWMFFLIFGLTIGGIQSLGWWTRQASGQSQVTDSKSTGAGHYHQKREMKHWRSMIIHQ